jgi:WD40 repeat protein
MAWDKINRRVFVGLQTGLIKQYQTDSDYNKISVLDDIRVHTGRVSALFYDSRRNFLVIVLLILFSYEKLSVSRDETIVLYSVDSRRELSSLKPMISSLMSLAIDVELQRGFIGSSSGKILIVDFSKTTIRFLYAIDAHASVVRSLYFERTNGYLFTGTFEQICSIWKVGNPGEESVSTKKVGVLRGGPSFNIKSVLFIPSRKAVVTGHESGYLAFWHTRDGNLINVVKVHDQAIVGLSWEDSSAELMTISRDGSVSIWSLTGREVSFRPHVKDDMYARIMKS